MRSLDAISVPELRKRRSAKWTMFPPDVLPAWVAEMDFPLDDGVRNALLDAIAHDDCGYANGNGAGVGDAFSAFAAARYDWKVEPRNVFVIPDVLVGISEILRTLTKPGARIVVNSPVYPPFFRVIRETERTAEDVPLLRGEDGSWTLDLAGLERAFAAGAAAYLLCSPHNPLGMVFDLTTLACIAELAKEYGVLVISDEIHAPLTLPSATFVPFLPIGEYIECDCLALTAASKAWNLPGLKCAVAVAGSERMRKKLALTRAELPWSAGNLGLVGTIAAFTQGTPWLDHLLEYLDGNRKRLTQLLATALPGVRYIEPEASYLAWLDCTALDLGPDPVAVFLERGRVALTRGRDFGPGAEAFVRLNFGTSSAILGEIVERMSAVTR
jgi:cysteine-S-conjugate beta-lyase